MDPQLVDLVCFLGFMVSRDSIRVDPTKISTVVDSSVPTIITSIWSFHGPFVADLSQISMQLWVFLLI